MAEKESTKDRGNLKLLYVYKILFECTDSEHSITMPQIQEKLNEYGFSAGRKAIYDYIDDLRALGADIISGMGKHAGYCLASRTFDLPELKLLADAIASSRFFTEKKAKELIQKLETLCSEHEAASIRRQVYIANRITTDNELIYYNVNEIHRAIAEKKKISFEYFDYDVRKHKQFREDLHICSPYALTWRDENYYLIAYYEKYNGISHFRVDKMEFVQILDEPAQRKPRGFRLADYLKSTFSMFSGEEEYVILRFTNKPYLVRAVIDRFGKQVNMRADDDDQHFMIRIPVRTSAPSAFFSWIFQFGTDVQIIEPTSLKEEYVKSLKAAAKANK